MTIYRFWQEPGVTLVIYYLHLYTSAYTKNN